MSNQPPSNVPPQDVSNQYDQELANPPANQSREVVNPSALRNEAQERSKQRPILQKILSLFQKEKADFRELIINSEPLEKRVALLVDGILDKFEIERESDNRMVGGIFKGRIKNLDPGLKAAFVDIGFNKNAFSFVCEFPHMKRRPDGATKPSSGNRRRLLLRAEADELFFISVLLGEWNKVKGDVNKKSPFYTQVAARMPGREEAVKAPRLNSRALTDAANDRPALEGEERDARLQAYYNVCWNWQFLRLLEDSPQTLRIKSARARVKELLLEFYGELEDAGTFSGLEPVPVGRLVKAQLGSGLIVLNSMLERGH